MLKDTEFAYAVARIRSNEYKLLQSSAIENLISAKDEKEAEKILSEAGYGDFEKFDADKLLSLRQKEAFELIYESAPDKKCLDFLILKNDFHNIKALLKTTVAGIGADGVLLSPSIIEPKLIKQALDTKDYSILPKPFDTILKEAYSLITETMDGQVLEIFLDKKCIETSIMLANQTNDSFSVSLSKLMATLSNIKIILRCIKTGKDKDFLSKAVADFDSFDKASALSAFENGTEGLCSFVKSLGFNALSESINKGYASFEKVCDDMLVEKIKDAKYQCLGIAPLVAYYFATDAEIKTVRIILSCKKNGFDVENIRERVRVLYV